MGLRNFVNVTNTLFLLSIKTYPVKIPHLNHHFKIFYKMNALYLISEKGSDKLSAKFCFQHKSLSSDKVFNFERNTSETLNDFLIRLNDKVSRLVEKKFLKKKKTSEDHEIPPITSEFLLDNQPLTSNTRFEDIFNHKIIGNLKLRVYDNDYDVFVNAPIVNIMTLPNTIRVNGLVYPEKFDASCVDKKKSTFTWLKRAPKTTHWTECGEGFCYIPKEEDFNHFIQLVCTPVNESQTGPISQVTSKLVVQKFPECEEIKKRLEYTKNKTTDDEVRIVSYNILADIYLHTKEAKTTLFTYCDPEIIELDYRKDLLALELIGYNADLLLLQEVEKKVFENFLTPLFDYNNYDGAYHEKESTREGFAFLYNTKKFKLLDSNQYFLSKELLNNPKLSDFKEKLISNDKLWERILNLPTQIQVGVLECLTKSNELILFGNTHLYFHPDADHIRLIQGLTAFRILHNISEEVKKMHADKHLSLLLCGDFNSTPECGFHKFLNEGSVDGNEIDWKSKEDEAIENITCSHSLKMKSAYGSPKYTNYTSLFKACLDYIYFQTDRLEVKQIVPIPEEEVLAREVALPSHYFPSDHVALVADLKFKNN